MVKVNGTKFKVYELDTDTSIISRIAVELKTLPKYLFFTQGQTGLKSLKNIEVVDSLQFIKDKYTALELGLDPSLPDLIINNKNILIASNYGSPQGRKRAIVGDYVIPEITHSANNHIHINKILEALGPPLNNGNSDIIDPSFQLTLVKSELTDHFYDSEIPIEWYEKAKRLKTDHGFMGKMDFPDRTDRLCRTIMATESYCSR